MVIMLMPPPTTATTAYLVTLVMNSSTITMFIKDRSSKKPRQNQLRGSRTVTQNRLCHEFPDRARRGNRWPCRFFLQTLLIGRIFRGWLDKKVTQVSVVGNSTKTPTALASAAAKWKGAKKTAWQNGMGQRRPHGRRRYGFPARLRGVGRDRSSALRLKVNRGGEGGKVGGKVWEKPESPKIPQLVTDRPH